MQSEMDPHPQPSVQLTEQKPTSTTPEKSLNPVVKLQRNLALDAINREMHFKEILKMMEEMHRD